MALRWSQGNRNVLERILNPKMSEWIRSAVPFLPFDSCYGNQLSHKDSCSLWSPHLSAPGSDSSAKQLHLLCDRVGNETPVRGTPEWNRLERVKSLTNWNKQESKIKGSLIPGKSSLTESNIMGFFQGLILLFNGLKCFNPCILFPAMHSIKNGVIFLLELKGRSFLCEKKREREVFNLASEMTETTYLLCVSCSTQHRLTLVSG